jgi:hypothetical protein
MASRRSCPPRIARDSAARATNARASRTCSGTAGIVTFWQNSAADIKDTAPPRPAPAREGREQRRAQDGCTLHSAPRQAGHGRPDPSAWHAGTPAQGLAWDVSPVTERWLEQNANRLSNAPQLAVLGYGLAHFAGSPASGDAAAQLAAGLEQLMRRDPYPSDGVTFLNDPRQLLAIGLAARAVHGRLP